MFILFIIGIGISCILLKFYPGSLWQPDSEKVFGVISKEVWNKEGEMVFVPDGNLVRILVTGVNNEDVSGKKVEIRGDIFQPEGARNPGGYSQKNYLYGKNVMLIMKVSSVKVIGNSFSVRATGASIRRYIEWSVYSLIDEECQGFLLGVMTGDTSALGQDEKQWIRLSGISHIMAVSGTHVTYILMPVRRLVKRKSLDIAFRSALCLVPLFVFVMAAGFSASVVRAGVMCAAELISKITGRRNDTLNSFGLAGCICLLMYPFAVADTGFVLSFGAVFSGMTILPALKKFIFREKEPVRFLDILLYGVSVNIGLLPIMLYKFNMISLSGVIITMIAAPLSAIMCIFGYIMVIVYYFAFIGGISDIVAAGLTLVTKGLSYIARLGAEIPVIRTVSPELWFFLLYYGIVIWLCCKSRKKYFNRKTVTMYLTVAFLVGVIPSVANRTLLAVSWLDVGQGACALVKTENGKTLLVDGGNGYTDVSSLLWKQGIGSIDWVILSHGDSDHVTGLYKVLQQHKVRNLIVPDNTEDSGAMDLVEEAKSRGINVVKFHGEGHFSLDNVLVELYCSTDKDSLNNSSVVVQLTANDSSFLLPGDLETDGEAVLSELNFLKQCDVITASHHGSQSGTGIDILTATEPKIAVISVGKNNMYGHPHNDVLQRLQEVGAYVFRTDRDGAVIMNLKEKDILGFEIWLKRESIQFRK